MQDGAEAVEAVVARGPEVEAHGAQQRVGDKNPGTAGVAEIQQRLAALGLELAAAAQRLVGQLRTVGIQILICVKVLSPS